MTRLLLLAAPFAFAAFAPAARAAEALPAVAPVLACADLARANVSSPEAPTAILSAAEQEIKGRKLCVVKGVVSPRVNFEARLPVAGWTQRYLQTGCGGLCGRVSVESPQRDCPAEERGEFVMASTDLGHDGQGGLWAASDMQLRVDFGYRAVHVAALAVKGLIRAYYGQEAKYSYFSGCSDGGREALMAAQRYPEDFDGVAAGAPAMAFLLQNSLHHGWSAKIVDPDGKSPALTSADLPTLHKGAVAACDALDGAEDGLISDPAACAFDPKKLVCKPDQKEGCLSERAAAAAAEIYRGAHDGDVKLVPGGLAYGSEMGWAGVLVPRDPSAPPPPMPPKPEGADQPQMKGPMGVLAPKIVAEMFPFMALTTPYDPAWRVKDLEFSAATLEKMRPMRAIFDATNPDLSPFYKAGGRLILWHGLSDQHISPFTTLAYAQSVRATMGDAAADETMRAFLIPGLAHCGGGEGLTSLDVMSPLMDWVESKKAPEFLVASASDEAAAAGKGRRIFPFPTLSALAKGANPEDPAAWTPGPAMKVDSSLYKAWAGAEHFKPGFQKFCGFEGLEFVCRP